MSTPTVTRGNLPPITLQTSRSIPGLGLTAFCGYKLADGVARYVINKLRGKKPSLPWGRVLFYTPLGAAGYGIDWMNTHRIGMVWGCHKRQENPPPQPPAPQPTSSSWYMSTTNARVIPSTTLETLHCVTKYENGVMMHTFPPQHASHRVHNNPQAVVIFPLPRIHVHNWKQTMTYQEKVLAFYESVPKNIQQHYQVVFFDPGLKVESDDDTGEIQTRIQGQDYIENTLAQTISNIITQTNESHRGVPIKIALTGTSALFDPEALAQVINNAPNS
ncbi:hypothetical protein COB21_06265, partial [Candidatus Aerophobetes bacterium]